MVAVAFAFGPCFFEYVCQFKRQPIGASGDICFVLMESKKYMKKIHLIRTHVSVGIGGPIPPLELLYVASQIEKKFENCYTIKITDTGIGELSEEDLRGEIDLYKPDIICLYAMAWEAGFVHILTALVKSANKDIIIIIFGQLATLAKSYLCEDQNIDYVIVGEPELTVVDLLEVLENQEDCSKVDGLVYKTDGTAISTKPRVLTESLDGMRISSSAWDLIDIKAYAQYANWNGALKEDFYIPILTSRGCPFPCTFCLETYDKQFRARSPESVISEIKFLQDKYNVKEIHIFDAIFNYDNERAKSICQAIIDSGINISLAFPHGIRADIMTDDLIKLLRQAGTYKLVYGIETGSSRMQKLTRKNLDLSHVNEVIRKTADLGIITGGYFMLGFPTETEEEMNQTIDFAVNSDLDVASFFKATDYNDILKIYKSKSDNKGAKRNISFDFKDISYYSIKGSQAQISAPELNAMILKAQRKFYLNLGRMWRGIKKYPSKRNYIKNVTSAVGLILQAYLMQKLTPEQSSKKLSSGSEPAKEQVNV